jgi:ribosomal protein L30E
MTWKKELQTAVKGGKLVLGVNGTLKSLKKSQGKFAVVASDCPETKTIEYYAKLAKVPVHDFGAGGKDLGATVKKPFSVSVVLVK